MAMAENIVMSEMTWTEVDEALKDRPVAILPIGATEAHGPHLAASADTVSSPSRWPSATDGQAQGEACPRSSCLPSPSQFGVRQPPSRARGRQPETATALIRDILRPAGKQFAPCIAKSTSSRNVECVKLATEEPRRRAPASEARRPKKRGPTWLPAPSAGRPMRERSSLADDGGRRRHGARARAHLARPHGRPYAALKKGRQDVRRSGR